MADDGLEHAFAKRVLELGRRNPGPAHTVFHFVAGTHRRDVTPYRCDAHCSAVDSRAMETQKDLEHVSTTLTALVTRSAPAGAAWLLIVWAEGSDHGLPLLTSSAEPAELARLAGRLRFEVPAVEDLDELDVDEPIPYALCNVDATRHARHEPACANCCQRAQCYDECRAPAGIRRGGPSVAASSAELAAGWERYDRPGPVAAVVEVDALTRVVDRVIIELGDAARELRERHPTSSDAGGPERQRLRGAEILAEALAELVGNGGQR